MPGVIGCIDGSSIPIRTPAHKIKSTYSNRHDIPSITLQAICDYKKKFIDVFTGAPGKIHDARVFGLSDICKELPLICENKYHIIGDGAYSIRNWLLVPYKNYGNLTEEQRTFNKTFCATRVLIENAFGLLKSRFRQLLQIEMHSVDKITKFIISCCVLHNMCIDMHDYIDLDDLDEVLNLYNENELIDSNDALRRNGEAKRDAIKNSLQYL